MVRLAAVLILCLSSTIAVALDFPALSGRVVDQAGVMTAASKSDVEAKSKALEDKSSIQLVVATVKSLQGSDIETYANQLFRFWKIGEAKKNNGVLLLVAPNEHKVRIEVGYGLEGTLTDALSSVIISSAIVPRFKTGDYSGGIERGVDGIISVLSGDTADWQPKPQCPHRRRIVRLRYAVSDPIFRDRDLYHLVSGAPCGRAAVGWRRPARRAELHSLWRWLGIGAVVVALATAADLAADFPVAADRPVAAALQGAGDGIHQGTI